MTSILATFHSEYYFLSARILSEIDPADCKRINACLFLEEDMGFREAVPEEVQFEKNN